MFVSNSNSYITTLLLYIAVSICACSSNNTSAQKDSDENSDYKKNLRSNPTINSTNSQSSTEIEDKRISESKQNDSESKYFTQTEIRELSQAFKHDSCDMTKFNQQTKKYSFSNNYGNPYADGQDSIDELNETSSCLLIQHAKINTFNNRFLVDDKHSNKLQSTEVDLKSNIINKIIFSIDYSKFPSCNLYQEESPFMIVFLKNDSGDIKRSIVKSEYENFDCYENTIKNMLTVETQPVEIDKKWQGVYEYSTYETVESKGTGVGAEYAIKILENSCNIDIEGYQVYSHFECNIVRNAKSNHIDIYRTDNKSKFAEIKITDTDKYLINITYYDEYSGIDNSFVPLEKSDRISN